MNKRTEWLEISKHALMYQIVSSYFLVLSANKTYRLVAAVNIVAKRSLLLDM